MAGVQGPYFTSQQALSDPQEGNSGGPYVWTSKNHTHKTETQVMTSDVLQALPCPAMEDKEEMANLARINILLPQSLTQAQETMLVLSKQLQALQSQSKENTPTTDISLLHKNTGGNTFK